MTSSIITRDDEDLSARKNKRQFVLGSDVGAFRGNNSSKEFQSYSINELNEVIHDFETEGAVKVSLSVHDNDENKNDGLVLEFERSDLKLFCAVPPKPGSRIFAFYQGHSGFIRHNGFANSALRLGYCLNSRTSLFQDFSTESGLFKLSYGASYGRGHNVTEFIVYYPPSTHPQKEPFKIIFRTQYKTTRETLTNFVFGFSSLSPLSTMLSTLKINFTYFPSIKIRFNYFCNQPLQVIFQRRLESSLKHSIMELTLAIGLNKVHLAAVLKRRFIGFTSIGIGIGHSTYQGLSWIFSIERGDVSLTVPINILSKLNEDRSSLKYVVSSLYLGLLSKTIINIIHDYTEGGRSKVSSSYEIEQLRRSKLRIDAEDQIKLMLRRADINMSLEESKSGLVILTASYFVEGGDCLDVSTPLKFWVLDSTLEIGAGSFGNMLGFYNINSSQISGVDVVHNSNETTYIGRLWEHFFPSYLNIKTERTPMLYVKYKFNEKVSQITVLDSEGLYLPNPSAELLP